MLMTKVQSYKPHAQSAFQDSIFLILPIDNKSLFWWHGHPPAETDLISFPGFRARARCKSRIPRLISYCRPNHKVLLGFMKGLNNKIRVIQRRAYGIRNMHYFRPKVITAFIENRENDRNLRTRNAKAPLVS